MEKKKYELPEIKVLKFEVSDNITLSGNPKVQKSLFTGINAGEESYINIRND